MDRCADLQLHDSNATYLEVRGYHSHVCRCIHVRSLPEQVCGDELAAHDLQTAVQGRPSISLAAWDEIDTAAAEDSHGRRLMPG